MQEANDNAENADVEEEVRVAIASAVYGTECR
jgi:hypothetical protein